MKKKLALAVLTASFYVAFPLVAQNSQTNNNGNHGTGGNHGDGNNGNHGEGNNGNNSNHSGHDDDGNSAGHRQDRPHGFGDRNLILSNHTDAAAVAGAVTSVAASLKSGSMVTPAGSPLPSTVQTRTYALLAAPVGSSSAAEYSAALSTAGPEATAIVPSLVRAFSALKSDPAQLPSVVTQFNSFTKAASTTFISDPPPEFLAMHAVLGRLVTAAAGTKVSSTK